MPVTVMRSLTECLRLAQRTARVGGSRPGPAALLPRLRVVRHRLPRWRSGRGSVQRAVAALVAATLRLGQGVRWCRAAGGHVARDRVGHIVIGDEVRAGAARSVVLG